MIWTSQPSLAQQEAIKMVRIDRIEHLTLQSLRCDFFRCGGASARSLQQRMLVQYNDLQLAHKRCFDLWPSWFACENNCICTEPPLLQPPPPSPRNRNKSNTASNSARKSSNATPTASPCNFTSRPRSSRRKARAAIRSTSLLSRRCFVRGVLFLRRRIWWAGIQSGWRGLGWRLSVRVFRRRRGDGGKGGLVGIRGRRILDDLDPFFRFQRSQNIVNQALNSIG